MGINFTPAQQKVLDARDHNILVSAAAGSGKTAVLVERIVRLVSEGDHPADIDRLLVVTFTRAAAAQMRERIGQAISARLREDPGNTHLQRQEVLLHNAQITTMDSFFTFLLRNYFSDIDLDPGFRQIDATESGLIQADVLRDFLEEKYAQGDPAFLRCAAYFCPGQDDTPLEKLITELCSRAQSHPAPEAWLRDHAADYEAADADALYAMPWMRSMVLRTADMLLESDSAYDAMREICLQPGGPDPVLNFLEEEQEGLFGKIRSLRGQLSGGEDTGAEEMIPALWDTVRASLQWTFGRYPTIRGKKYDYIDPARKDAVKAMRDAEKTKIRDLGKALGDQSADMILASMAAAAEPVRTILSLTLEFMERCSRAKRDRHVIDFVDLEHFALGILAERQEDGSWKPRRAARALRAHYAEILIDEYQDSNEVQELMLQIISGEDDGRNNRFMVGDIKQSIYRFRLARPEIFMQKYDSYLPDDPQTERIELDQNFRSRGEVLDCVNALFMRIMRREVGGVEYNENVSLKKGAVFPDETRDEAEESPYRAEFLLLDPVLPEDEDNGSGASASGAASGSGRGGENGGAADADNDGLTEDDEEEAGDDGMTVLAGEIGALTERQKEALLIAGKIKSMVGVLPVRDEESGQMRPARYGDIVILLRGTVGWNEDLRAVFDREGIPAYAESRTGYFAAREIRAVIELLRVLDNPRQDIPLYGAMRGFFGDFSEDELVRIRLAKREGMLYDALRAAAGEDSVPADSAAADSRPADSVLVDSAPADSTPVDSAPASSRPAGSAPADSTHADSAPAGGSREGGSVPDALREKCALFLEFIRSWRRRARYAPVSEIVTALLEETGYQDYCEALPAGVQRTANLRLLRNQADAFTKTDFTGLFQFLRYIDGLHRQEIDYGEANTLDENADVVRIMTIHKSKGLEFPICFVAGLSKPFSFRRHDASGLMLYDSDWGVGVDYCDPVSRVRATTLRREELAEKIRRDCMGEELRVLYVAMTRAKEKLILTASVKNLQKKIESWQAAMSGFFHRPDDERLSPFMIVGASSYAQLICQAVMAHEGQEAALPQTNAFPMRISFCTPEDLSMQSAQEQLYLSRMEEILRGMEGRPLDAQPDPAAAHALADRIFRVYPHAELQDLYAQTSVSEIKHRAMREAMRSLREAAEGTEEGSGTVEGAAELFPEETPVPYLPSFILREQGQTGAEEEAAVIPAAEKAGEGARRGTAFHRILELMDYSRQEEFAGEDGDAAVSAWIRTLVASDRISGEDAGLVSIPRVRRFLRSSLAARMGAADREGRLYREQPFVLGLPADRLDRQFPGEEMVTVQGIIDAFFIEEDTITLVDYKTDRVRTAQELSLRYSAQLALYAEALEKAFSLPVRERIIYSTALAEEVRL